MMRFALQLAVLMGLTGVYGQTVGAGPFQRENGFIAVAGEGATITSLRVDPSGQGRYGPNLVRSVAFDALASLPQCVWEQIGDSLVISGLELRQAQQIEIQPGPEGVPDPLPAGHVLGQSFTVPEGGVLHSVAIRVPTWHSTTSGATLRLRREGPGGEVIASRRLVGIPDNSQQGLTFDPQPAGRYVVELTEPTGSPGWWGRPDDSYAGGEALVDGEPVPGRDRSLTVTYSRGLGPARLRVSLDGPQLTLAAELLPGTEPMPLVAIMQVPWDNTGYDVSARAVPFFRFFTDNQRYLPAEQFKRAESPGVSFGPCRWMEADGTGNADLRFVGDRLGVSWSMTPDTATLRLTTRQTVGADGCPGHALGVQVLPRDDSLPADWPAFETPDTALSTDLNRLFYERAFSYPAPAGPAAWLAWMSHMRAWFTGPLREGEAANLRGTVVGDAGYVYTWGASPGWPFPDNTLYDTRHFDTNARFILGCWHYLSWTRDEDFARSQAERIRRAMEYQLDTLGGREGLIVTASKDVTGRHQGVGNNYWDILPFGHLDAYANALFYASLEAMANIETLLETMPDVSTVTLARSPREYRDLAARTREAYNQLFWDDEKGRYIGCVDLDGKRHDYGFTFVNLEAMAYGLASPEQARRIYQWMEQGTSSSGQADIYSRWVFAPRATTVHNPMWDEHGVNDPQAEGVEPWWHFGWRGTPFGEQCQDGGAIFYTSYFDLMARTRLLGPEQAWRRWEEILARYREPDRLCGGPPLFRGEIPQQANPGSVGLDIPFPESGLVPLWFLYGAAGVEPTPEGLRIAPHLPRALPWLRIRNVCYRNLVCHLRVTPTEVELVSDHPGYEFTWRAQLDETGAALFTAPPSPVPGFPPRPQDPSPWRARWIWAQGNPEEVRDVWARGVVDLPTAPERATLVASADNECTVYVNGTQALQATDWSRLFRADITRLMQAGRNVIAVHGHNAGGPAGLLIQVRVETAGQTRIEGSGEAWRVSTTAAQGWEMPTFDDSQWTKPADLGAPPIDPWGDPGEP